MAQTYVSKEEMTSLVGRLMEKIPVIGPVREDEGHRFRLLQRSDDLDLGYRNTLRSPKELFHPHSEWMFTYSLRKDDPEKGVLKEVLPEAKSRVVWGIRPCDAKALQLVDVNFLTDTYRDPWWEKRREETVLVGLGCSAPCDTCFCTSVGSGPFDKSALDVLITEIEGGYVIEAVTEKGASLLDQAAVGTAADEAQQEAAAEAAARAVETLSRPFDWTPLREKPQTELFDAEFWEEIQFACINCGTCTYLCPTCWCFDIQDEVHQGRGVRLRIWDSCMYPLFTLHGSGHNPRGEKLQRVRQRFMHKFKYYIDKYGNGPACVGCGRCVQYCPVNIDIRRVVSVMAASCACAV